MKLLLRRPDTPVAGYTDGNLFINGVWFCFTLEDEDRGMEKGGVKIYGKTAIPRGLYKVIIDFSQRFQKLMPRVLGVPGFSGIRIHTGNLATDTDGCILVGATRNKAGEVRNSVLAYNRLMILLEDALDRGEELTLEVV